MQASSRTEDLPRRRGWGWGYSGGVIGWLGRDSEGEICGIVSPIGFIVHIILYI